MSVNHGPFHRPGLSLLLVMLLTALPLASYAVSVTVTNTADGGPGSLRAAIAAVQASTDAADAITITAQGTISLTGGELLLSNPNVIAGKTVAITGPGAGALFVSGNRGNNSTRVFHFSGLNVALNGLAVIQGIVTTGSQGGAGILQEGGALTMDHCVVADCLTNVSNALGGGIVNLGGALTLTHCVVTGNALGPAIGAGAGGIGSQDGSLSLTDCVVNNNGGVDTGGGIISLREPLTLTRCTVSSNSAGGINANTGFGGGIYSSAGAVTLTDCVITRNSANDAGDGVYVAGGSAALQGCTLSGNEFFNAPPPQGLQFYGGGLCSVGATVSLTNCTLDGNGAAFGGGIYNAGALTLTACTFYGNSAGNLYNASGGTATVAGTILAGDPSGSNVVNNGGTLTSLGSNLVGDPDGSGFTNGVNHDQTGVAQAGLAAQLADNGGPTPTLALNAGSPAIDANYALPAQATDQRGAARPVGARSDIGAFEYGATATANVPDSFIVTNTNDDGDGSLRRAVNNADADPGAQITFDPSVFGPGMPHTISLTSGPLVLRQTMAVTGPGRDLVAVSGGHTSRVVTIIGSDTETLSGLTLTGGNAGDHGSGGGIDVSRALSVVMTDCAITDCTASLGGALSVNNLNSSVTLTDCLIADNSAPGGLGGGVYNFLGSLTMTDCTFAGNSAASGGGLYNNSVMPISLNNCTLSGNTATTGGGLYNAGLSDFTACTISGNTATTGGGVYSAGNLLFLAATTVSANAAETGSGLDNAGGTALVLSTILAGNTGGSNVSNGGTITSLGSNLVGDPDGSGFTNGTNSDQTGVTNPGLGPLQNNGGPTQTMALLAGSPAIDAEFNGSAAGVDQRGAPRPQGIRDDIGAYEYGYPEAVDDTYTVPENSTLTISAPGVLANDVADGNALTAVAQTLPAHGFLFLNGDGSFTYTPDAGFVGTDTFTYQAQGDSGDGGDGGGTEIEGPGGQGGTATVTITVAPLQPPTTTASLSGTNGSNGYYRSAVTVTLSATDPSYPSSRLTTTYSVDGGPTQTYSAPGVEDGPATGTGPFVVAGDGTHAVTFSSVNPGGAAEALQNVTIKIDATPPTLTFGTPSPAANASGYTNSSVSIPYAASDATSGVASSAPGSPVTFTSEGAHQTQTVTVTDIAGNTATFTTPTVSIDRTPPVTTASTAGSPSGTQVTLAATDALSGVAGTRYALDGAASQAYTAPFTVQTNGPHTVTFSSTDNAGNAETTKTVNFTVNIAGPHTALRLAGPQGTNGWYTGTVTVTLTATPGGLPTARTVYSVDGGATQTYTAPFPVPGDGLHTVTFYSVDTAGTVESPNQQAIKIDGTPPATTIALAQVTPHARPQAAGATFSGPVRVTLSAGDALSGVAATAYALDGGAAQSYTAPFAVSASGLHTVTYFSTDIAGNKEAAQTATFTIVSASAPVLHTFPAGLQLFSVPKDMSGIPLGQALNQTNPRLAVWVPTLLQYILTPTAPADALRPGQGYWARFSGDANLYDLGTPTPTGQPFAIPVHQGWNMIGDPFPAAASPSSLRLQTPTGTFGLGDDVARTLLSPTTYTYDSGAGQYRSHSLRGESLTPYVGYWLFSRCDGSLLVSPS